MLTQSEITRLSEEVARRVITRIAPPQVGNRILVPIGVSGRHIHLTREVLESLFGKGYQLTHMRSLSQPGEFAAQETVTIVGPRGAIEKVRLLGPLRQFTQVELARSDGLKLGLDLPVRRTGDLAGSPGITLVGPNGTVVLKQGAIRGTRHIHMSPHDGERFSLVDGQIVRVKIEGPRALVLENVLVRVSSRFALDFHIDTDDANAAGVTTGCLAEVLV